MDTIADILVVVVNGQRTGKERVVVSYSSFKERLITFLQAKGAVSKVRVKSGDKPKLVVTLAYDGDRPKIREMKRLSRPGRRLYVTHEQLPWSGGRVGFYVLSTSEGLMDEKEAREKKLGGELICSVWS